MRTNNKNNRKRGIVAVISLVLITVLCGFAALTLDVGVMYNTRADLQIAADAAALAGATAFAADSMTSLRMNPGNAPLILQVSDSMRARIDDFGYRNGTFGVSSSTIEPGDVLIGTLDLTNPLAVIDPTAAEETYNGVQVTVRRTVDSANGPVGLFFARIFGKSEAEIIASATAVLDDRIAGFDPGSGGMLPFTISESMYNNYIATGGDDYGYDGDTESITSGSDDIREINLYPQNLTPGNFGLLNIGTPNQSTPALRDHIENGVPPEDYEAETGSSQLTFYDENGNPTTYNISGNPGLRATLESSIADRIGQVVGFFLHDQATGVGANTNYRITSIRFGRVMDVRLTGPPAQQGLWIQPVTYVGPDVLLSPNAPSSGGVAGQLVLAR